MVVAPKPSFWGGPLYFHNFSFVKSYDVTLGSFFALVLWVCYMKNPILGFARPSSLFPYFSQ